VAARAHFGIDLIRAREGAQFSFVALTDVITG
jgi:hypothetical protein